MSVSGSIPEWLRKATKEQRGKCRQPKCGCTGYEEPPNPSDSKKCNYCGHYPTVHKLVQSTPPKPMLTQVVGGPVSPYVVQVQSPFPTELRDEIDLTTAKVRKAVALYDSKGTSDEEMSFSEGDVICVVNSSHVNWWLGFKDKDHQKRLQFFPNNYVEWIDAQ